MKSERRVTSPIVPVPVLEASPAELIAKVNAQSARVKSLVATVDLEPSAGSVYSGVIKEYRDVRGFILLDKPEMIRIIGQAPVVRTTIFDMVSDGKKFKLSVPTKQKFIVGPNEFQRPAKNSLENLRPQHIRNALVVPPIDTDSDKLAVEQDQEGGRRYYVLTVLENKSDKFFSPNRKLWLDRANLELSRLQLYGPMGLFIEDVHYGEYQDFNGVHYPKRIEITRPMEDYSLAISIQKATFNQPIAPEKFELKKPESAQLVELKPEEEKGEEHDR